MKLALSDFKVRPATRDDMKTIKNFMQELVRYHRSDYELQFSVEELIRDGFETDHSWFNCLVAENLINHELIGYAMYYPIYTMMGRSATLEHIYVEPEYRNCQIGTVLFKEVVKHVLSWNCVRLKLEVIDWNPAKTLYERFGAVNYTKDKQLYGYHFVSKTVLENIVNTEIK